MNQEAKKQEHSQQTKITDFYRSLEVIDQNLPVKSNPKPLYLSRGVQLSAGRTYSETTKYTKNAYCPDSNTATMEQTIEKRSRAQLSPQKFLWASLQTNVELVLQKKILSILHQEKFHSKPFRDHILDLDSCQAFLKDLAGQWQKRYM